MGFRLDGKNPLAYMGIRPTTPPQMVVNKRAPTTQDFQGFVLGTQWLYVDESDANESLQYVLVSVAQNNAVWLPLNEADTFIAPDHSVLLGTGTTTIGYVGPSSFVGLPLQSNGDSADPIFATLGVFGGGTGQNDLTQYSVLLGNGTDPVQFASPPNTVGIPLVAVSSTDFPEFGIASVSGGGTGLDVVPPYVVVCGGISGEGPLQTVSGVGTASQVLTSNGLGFLPSWQDAGSGGSGGGGPIAVQVFTTSGTYTPTAGMARCIVELIGGGAGGQSVDTTSMHPIGGNGGGGGAYCRKLFTSGQIGASQPVVIGTGGAADTDGVNSTFGTGPLLTAGKGLAVPGPGFPGSGGTATGGDINVRGGNGGISSEDQSGVLFGGAGGSSFYGVGGLGQGPSDSTGFPGLSYGAGGSGAVAEDASETEAGGAGSAGICVITEWGPFATPPQAVSINTIYLTTPGAGTYTPTPGMFQCSITCLAGGGGGGAVGGVGVNAFGAGGGGGGSWAIKLFDSATIGASQSYVVGAGGAGGTFSSGAGSTGGSTTFGSFITCTGGGGAGSGLVNAVAGAYGVGGTATGGDINIPGQSGGGVYNLLLQSQPTLTGGVFSCGANGPWGVGGISNVNAAPTAALGYGSGGGSSSFVVGQIGVKNGTAGAGGLIIITEYIS